MSTLKVNSIEPANAGSEDYFLARAWVNFNGSGTVSIRADGNVSSITDNGTGYFSVNFTSSMSDANYSTSFTGGDDTGSGAVYAGICFTESSAYATASITFRNVNTGEASRDATAFGVQIFR